MSRPETRDVARFDAQARAFDARAGLPPPALGRIADAIIDMAALGPGARAIDVGAGTGEIGRELLTRGVACIALDESQAMLDVFREKAGAAGIFPELVAGDARFRWPIGDVSMNLVFGSRSLHWLSAEHVAAEAFRVASDEGCAILVGRVRRDPEGPRARIRRAMREFLGEAGYVGRNGAGHAHEVVAACVARGATAIVPRSVATWSTRLTARSMLDAWAEKAGLGGADIPVAIKDHVLARTSAWAEATFGNIDVTVESEECYTLEGATLVAPR